MDLTELTSLESVSERVLKNDESKIEKILIFLGKENVLLHDRSIIQPLHWSRCIQYTKLIDLHNYFPTKGDVVVVKRGLGSMRSLKKVVLSYNPIYVERMERNNHIFDYAAAFNCDSIYLYRIVRDEWDHPMNRSLFGYDRLPEYLERRWIQAFTKFQNLALVGSVKLENRSLNKILAIFFRYASCHKKASLWCPEFYGVTSFLQLLVAPILE